MVLRIQLVDHGHGTMASRDKIDLPKSTYRYRQYFSLFSSDFGVSRVQLQSTLCPGWKHTFWSSSSSTRMQHKLQLITISNKEVESEDTAISSLLACTTFCPGLNFFPCSFNSNLTALPSHQISAIPAPN